MAIEITSKTSPAAFAAWQQFYARQEVRDDFRDGTYTGGGMWCAGYEAAEKAQGLDAIASQVSQLSSNELSWLLGVVRGAIRKSGKSVSEFTVRDGQDEGEASQVLAHFTERHEFQLEVHRKLREITEARNAANY